MVKTVRLNRTELIGGALQTLYRAWVIISSVKETVQFTTPFIKNVSQLHRCERWFNPFMNYRRSILRR